jgi:hypothetical protein
MALMYISEYTDSGAIQNGLILGSEPSVDQAPVVISASSAQSAAFQNNTRMVRVQVDSTSPASIVFGTNPTAVTNTQKRLVANQTEYFVVPLGKSYKIAVVAST